MLTTEPRYINLSTCLISIPSTFSLLEDITLNLIYSVLFAFSWSPSWLAKWLSLSVFSCISLCIDENKAISLSKSRSSRVVKMDHVIPLFEFVVIESNTHLLKIVQLKYIYKLHTHFFGDKLKQGAPI